MYWSASPGERSDYDGEWDDSWMGPNDEGYSDAAPFSISGCAITVEDSDNPLLYDCEDDGCDESVVSDDI